MINNKHLREAGLIFLVCMPFFYLWLIWDLLPDRVPMHWNFRGEIDRWGNKRELIWIPFLLPVLIYALLSIIPLIDPKKRIQTMGQKFDQLKFALVLFMSALAILIIWMTHQQATPAFRMVLFMLGLLFFLLGNFFKTIKPNYFMGIRTPWTLEHEDVWKKTHILGGKIWFVGGLLLMILSLIISDKFYFIVLFTIVAVITLVPVFYSYWVSRRRA